MLVDTPAENVHGERQLQRLAPCKGDNSSLTWQYSLGLDKGCVAYTKELPGSIGVNYRLSGSSPGVITPNIDITEGSKGTIVCSSCWAYFGAAIRMQVDYKISWAGVPGVGLPTGGSFDILATLTGKAGYNLDLSIKIPTISKSYKYDIKAGGSVFEPIPIVPGISIKFRPVKMYSTISGTGSATGSAQMKSGFSADLGIGFEGGSSLSWALAPPNPWKTSLIPPSVAYTSFSLKSFDVRVDLSTGIDLGVSLGGADIAGSEAFHSMLGSRLSLYHG